MTESPHTGAAAGNAAQLAALNVAVGDGYSQPCSSCLGILGKHATWCKNPFARQAAHGGK